MSDNRENYLFVQDPSAHSMKQSQTSISLSTGVCKFGQVCCCNNLHKFTPNPETSLINSDH